MLRLASKSNSFSEKLSIEVFPLAMHRTRFEEVGRWIFNELSALLITFQRYPAEDLKHRLIMKRGMRVAFKCSMYDMMIFMERIIFSLKWAIDFSVKAKRSRAGRAVRKAPANKVFTANWLCLKSSCTTCFSRSSEWRNSSINFYSTPYKYVVTSPLSRVVSLNLRRVSHVFA